MCCAIMREVILAELAPGMAKKCSRGTPAQLEEHVNTAGWLRNDNIHLSILYFLSKDQSFADMTSFEVGSRQRGNLQPSTLYGSAVTYHDPLVPCEGE